MGSERESKTDEQRAFQIACVVVSTRADQAFPSSFRLFLGPLGGVRWIKLEGEIEEGRRVSFLQRVEHQFQQTRALGHSKKRCWWDSRMLGQWEQKCGMPSQCCF